MNIEYLQDLKKSGIISKNTFNIYSKNLNFPAIQIQDNLLANYETPIVEKPTSNNMYKTYLRDINTYFDKIYIINLDSRPDRWVKMLKKLSKNNITNYIRFPAIDGRKEPFNTYFRNLRYFFDTPGAFGVLMSALFILKNAILNQYHKILILEDDAVFHHDFYNLFNQRINIIPDDWKLLYLGSSMHNWRINSKCSFKNGYLIPSGSIPGAFSLGIKKDCFIPLMKNILTFSSSWDLGPLKYINKIFYGKCLVLYPNLVIADTRDSNIRQGKSLKIKSSDCGWKLSDYEFLD